MFPYGTNARKKKLKLQTRVSTPRRAACASQPSHRWGEERTSSHNSVNVLNVALGNRGSDMTLTEALLLCVRHSGRYAAGLLLLRLLTGQQRETQWGHKKGRRSAHGGKQQARYGADQGTAGEGGGRTQEHSRSQEGMEGSWRVCVCVRVCEREGRGEAAGTRTFPPPQLLQGPSSMQRGPVRIKKDDGLVHLIAHPVEACSTHSRLGKPFGAGVGGGAGVWSSTKTNQKHGTPGPRQGP